jgi:hypothetical protein
MIAKAVCVHQLQNAFGFLPATSTAQGEDYLNTDSAYLDSSHIQDGGKLRYIRLSAHKNVDDVTLFDELLFS